MGKILILNKHHLKCDDPTATYIGRGSPLGNPYTVERYGRDQAIALYEVWLHKQIEDGNQSVISALDNIAYEVMDTGSAKLMCFCKPQRCHGDIIAKLILDKLHNVPAGAKPRGRVCDCGKGHRSAHDGKCGHCRTRKERDALDRQLRQPRLLHYAGIGSRETPEEVLDIMFNLGRDLADQWILRSGYADGADQAFFKGARSVGGKAENYLPWLGFNGSGKDPSFILGDMGDEVMALARRYHPAWGRLSQGAQKLHARNAYQILGKDLMTPSRMVICWTKDGKGGGGTGQALRIAKDHNIPIFDLALADTPERLIAFVNSLEPT